MPKYLYNDTVEVWAEQFDGYNLCYGMSAISGGVLPAGQTRYYITGDIYIMDDLVDAKEVEVAAGSWIVTFPDGVRAAYAPAAFAACTVALPHPEPPFRNEAWPARPTVHDGGRIGRVGLEPTPLGKRVDSPHWRERLGWRHCSYCGSIHPGDLLTAIARGARLGGADWKYGWPHKFYVEKAGPGAVKWYNCHIEDAGYRTEALAALLEVLEQHAGIRFELRPEGLWYSAPYPGFQRSGER